MCFSVLNNYLPLTLSRPHTLHPPVHTPPPTFYPPIHFPAHSLFPVGPGSGGGQPSQMMMVGPLMGGHLMPPITTQPTRYSLTSTCMSVMMMTLYSLVEVGGPLLMSGYNQQPLHAQPQVVWPVEACNDPRRGTVCSV